MSCLHLVKGFQRSFRCVPWGVLAPVIAAVLMLCSHTPADAAGLTIVPTFDSSITSLPGSAGIEGAINAAIGVLEKDVSSPNNITVTIDFQNITSGLGQSNTTEYFVNYSDYYNTYKAVATSPAQLTALASLGPAPASGGPNPVNGNSLMIITSAEGRNLGFNTPGGVGPGGTYDSVIGVNTSITSPPKGLSGNYGLQSVVAHEIDEALGIGGTGSTIGAVGSSGPVGDLDLYRYSAPGVRSYTTSDPHQPYFSINGGVTALSYFNQAGGGSDYGDWQSNPLHPGFTYQVQDAFGQPGTNPALGVNELTALNVIGYGLTSTIPEPSTVTMLGTAVLVASGYGWSRRKPRAGKTPA
jgi:hypothetical protein